MTTCARCGKRVFFAERKTSNGKCWHKQCLSCESCGKLLNPEQHGEHEGKPYCESPCYRSLLGSKSSPVSPSHPSFPQLSPTHTDEDKNIMSNNELLVTNNNVKNVSLSSPRIDGRAPKVSRNELDELHKKLRLHNEAHPDSYVNLIEKDGHVTLEGPLRVHWGVQIVIRFKQDDSPESTPFAKRILERDRSNTLKAHKNDQISNRDPFNTVKRSGVPSEISSQHLLAIKMKRGQFHTIKECKVKRRSSINGHYYKTETSDNFTPAFGSVTQVFTGSHHRTPEVIRRLLDKFKIENSPALFALYLVKINGEMWPLTDMGHPLMERINLEDPSARIFLMDKPHHVMEEQNKGVQPDTQKLSVWKPMSFDDEEEITLEIANYITLPDPMLHGFLKMFDEEQAAALISIQEKYEKIKQHMKNLLIAKLSQETYL